MITSFVKDRWEICSKQKSQLAVSKLALEADVPQPSALRSLSKDHEAPPLSMA